MELVIKKIQECKKINKFLDDICDSDNNICVSYDDLEVLYNAYNKS